MEERKEYKLKDLLLVPIRNGLTKPSAIRGKGVKMIGMKEIFSLDLIGSVEMERVPVTEKELESSNIIENDLLFARQSLSLEGAGKCSFVKEVVEPTVFESHIIRLRIDSTKANPLYIYYYFKSNLGRNQVKTLVQQVAAAGIKGKELIEIPISIPSVKQQALIVNILKSLDDKIEVNRRINENLEQQAQALFKSWFVDFEPFKDQPFVESELGMIPQGWKVVTLSDACAKVTDGSHYSPKDDPFGTIPMLSVKDMLHNGFDYSSCKKINEEEYEKMKANDCVPRVNDILVAKDGSYLKEIFMCNEEIKQAILSSIAIFRSNIDVIFPELLLQLLRLPKVKKDVGDNYVSGSALPRIVLKDFKKFKFVVAPIDIQKEIIETLKSINIRIHINEKESRRLAELRDALLPRLMSGELKVNDLENNEI